VKLIADGPKFRNFATSRARSTARFGFDPHNSARVSHAAAFGVASVRGIKPASRSARM
jgi:hypothetical protein